MNQLGKRVFSGVYPRLCGGNGFREQPLELLTGLSPLVRGKPVNVIFTSPRPGSIPACAGETSFSDSEYEKDGVYPRLCGGNSSRPSASVIGSGLSPLVRGKQGELNLCPDRSGSIPACAGETFQYCCLLLQLRVYPRLCGGNPIYQLN